MIIKINIKMNNQLQNLNKICPVYIILLTMLIWRISDLIHFLFKFSEENDIIKENTNVEDFPFTVRQETYNWFEKSLIALFDLTVIISYVMFIVLFSITISHLVDSNDSEKELILNDNRDKIIRILCLISFLMFMGGNSYKLGHLIISPLFYSVEKRFFNAPVKKFYYKLLYHSDKPGNLLEINKLCSNEKINYRFTQDLAQAKTIDLERNDEDSSLLKKLNNY